MRYAALLVLLVACGESNGPSDPIWPPPGPMLHIQNSSNEPLDISYRPAGHPELPWEELGQIPRHGGRCIRIAPSKATVLRAYSPVGEMRDSADLSLSPDWRWDLDLSVSTLEPITTICD